MLSMKHMSYTFPSFVLPDPIVWTVRAFLMERGKVSVHSFRLALRFLNESDGDGVASAA